VLCVKKPEKFLNSRAAALFVCAAGFCNILGAVCSEHEFHPPTLLALERTVNRKGDRGHNHSNDEPMFNRQAAHLSVS
jgi:hypothetical protein